MERWPKEFQKLVGLVASVWGCSSEILMSKSRRDHVAEPRYVIVYLASKHFHYALARIGRLLGYKDHTTALEANRLVPLRMEKNVRLRRRVERVEQLLTSSTMTVEVTDNGVKRALGEIEEEIRAAEKQLCLLRKAARHQRVVLDSLRRRQEALTETLGAT